MFCRNVHFIQLTAVQLPFGMGEGLQSVPIQCCLSKVEMLNMTVKGTCVIDKKAY